MKITLYSTHIIDTPPVKYGGLENICYLLARYLCEQNHTVHLFATRESYKPPTGNLFSAGAAGQIHPMMAWKAYWDTPQSKQALKEADIVCSMDWDYAPYAVANELKHICHVCHGPDPGFKTKPPIPKPCLIGVSKNHAKNMMRLAPGTEWRSVQNGIDLGAYAFKKEKEDYLLWVGRLYAPKGAHIFIDLMEKLQMKGIICGGSFGDDPQYRQFVQTKLNNSKYVTVVNGLGQEITHEEKVKLYQNARCVVQPSVDDASAGNFIEPFGLIVPEATACGTPVITVPSGGWNETCIHGINAFVCNTVDEMAYYVKRIDELRPEDCRKMAEHFSYKRMGREYELIFNEILEGRPW